MKYTAIVILFFIPLLVFGQESKNEDDNDLTEYNLLFNYTPKAIINDTASITILEKHKLPLNTIGQLYMHYGWLQQSYDFSLEQISFMEKRIDQIALGFYLEDNPILIESVGGYAGCPDKMMYKDTYLNKEVTIFRFCFSCTDIRKYHRKLHNIFNNRTKKLIDYQSNTNP